MRYNIFTNAFHRRCNLKMVRFSPREGRFNPRRSKLGTIEKHKLKKAIRRRLATEDYTCRIKFKPRVRYKLTLQRHKIRLTGLVFKTPRWVYK